MTFSPSTFRDLLIAASLKPSPNWEAALSVDTLAFRDLLIAASLKPGSMPAKDSCRLLSAIC